MEFKNKDVLFFELCRLCLNEKGSCLIFDVFNLAEHIFECTGVKVTVTETLPQKICKSCMDIVTQSAKLKTMALQNDVYLKSIVCKDNEEIESPTKTTVHNTDDSSYLIAQEPTGNVLSVRKDLFKKEPEVAIKEEDDSDKNKIPKIIMNKNGSTRYKCKICLKIFDKWKQFYLHQRSHNKNCVCPLDACSKKFATKSDLEKHMRAHTGERPYQCDECSRSFTQRVSLKSHKINIHRMSLS